MKKVIKLNKIIYTLIFAILSTLVFTLNIARPNMAFYANDNILYQYATEVWLSFKEFDTAYVTLFIFIYYAYYNIYFDGTKLSGKNFINSSIAIILTTITLIGKSYKIDNTLNTIVESTPQIIKFIILSFGYYFIFYAIIKKITSIKININFKKKAPSNKK